ncbi:MAG: ABC transporter permease subunit, partial [Planctomycetes bacterium]|nr:ABC transporter permease subunit [Planctomycetota bacterium]
DLPLIARDLKAGALEVYFSKPLLLSDYLAGKFMTIAFFLASITLFPALFLFFLDWFLAGSTFWAYLPEIMASSVLIITVCGLIVLAASSLARTARTAAIAWFGFHMALFVISRISTAIFRNSNLELIDIPTSLGFVAKKIFACPSTHSWHWSIPTGYLLLISWGALVILLRRVKGVEVIDS